MHCKVFAVKMLFRNLQFTDGLTNLKRGELMLKSSIALGGQWRQPHEKMYIKCRFLKTDRRLTCEEFARKVGVSRGSAQTILTSDLNMRRIAAWWVPHCLSDDQKTDRMDIAKTLLKRYIKDGESFLNRIDAIDETWIRSYEPELKRQSSEWHTPASTRSIKFRRKQGHLKMMMILAYDSVGALVAERVPLGKTVNSDVYRDFLMKKIRPTIRKKRKTLLNAKPLILHDNASCHKSEVTSLLMS